MNDKYFLDLAFKEAKKGYGFVSPNPMVGAVLVQNDKIIKKGHHKSFGGPHAEVEVLKDLDLSLTEGATLYVSLEPCVHFGKTPPCVDLILEKKIARVVFGQMDPNPLVSGKSIELLRSNGVEVVYIPVKNIEWLNRKFNKWIATGTPYICLKAGITLDAKIADSSNKSKWITGEKSRKHLHKMRKGFDAILVGGSTAKIDNPNLGLHSEVSRKPLFRFILTRDANFYETNQNLDIFRDENYMIINSIDDLVPSCLKLGISSVLVEGGGEVISGFIASDLYDELNLFVAPKILGSSHLDLFKELGIGSIDNALNLKFKSCKRIGSDILLKLVK